MEKKWYKTKGTKLGLIMAVHIFAAIIIASILCGLAYPVLVEEFLEGRGTGRYEDSYVFETSLKRYTNMAVNGIAMQDIWETNGEYDSKKIIDVEQYNSSGSVSGKNESGLAYQLEDLLNWDYETSDYESEDDYIIVCEREDGTYRYYRFREFKILVSKGELQVAGFTEDLFFLLDYLDETEGRNLSIQNDKNETVYVSCWKYTGNYFSEQYQPLGAESLLEIVNEDERWNGRLQEAVNMIEHTIWDLRENESVYRDAESIMQNGNTNFSFVYADHGTGEIYSNCSKYTKYSSVNQYAEELMNTGAYVVVTPKMDEFSSSIPYVDAESFRNAVENNSENSVDYIFIASIDETYTVQDGFKAEKEFYESFAASIRILFGLGILSALLFVICIIWLTAIAGNNLRGFDKCKTEIAAGSVGAIVLLAAVGGCVLFADTVLSKNWNNVYSVYVAFLGYDTETALCMAASWALFVLDFAVLLFGYLSLVRRIHAKTLWKNSILRKLTEFVGFALSNIREIWKISLAFIVFAGAQCLFVVEYYHNGGNGIFIVLMFLMDACVGMCLLLYAIGKDKIRIGIEKIAEGEIEYKISTEKMLSDHKRIAETVNTIGAGLDAAVEKSMRSERLKTDLITNVSHDIKTPLTSIINYIDLLKKEKLEDAKIQHYIEVLEQKAQRLKILTEDVVEASKVSSGNVSLEYMNINLVEMIQQTSGEFAEKFKVRGLKEILTLPDEEVTIRADGRRTWRILENIYNNAAKYAMEGSRVYADLKKIDGKAVFTLKNISEQPLNISAEELTERFIRGDVSRSTEGSGLGLSIARSLTELQGGEFAVYVDGDLFKVTVKF